MYLKIAPNIILSDSDMSFRLVRPRGPGGQHVNTTSSAVQLHFNTHTTVLPDYVRERLQQIAGNKINAKGILILKADEYRSQFRNKQAALQRLKHLLNLAARVPKSRKPTRPPSSSLEKRRQDKKQQTKKKLARQKIAIE